MSRAGRRVAARRADRRPSSRSIQASPGQASPGQASPGQASPGQASSGQASPGQASPGQASPGQASPGQASPGQASPGQASPGRGTPGDEPRDATRSIDAVHMARCLELAERFRGRTAPNPIVGCVIIDRTGRVLAEGEHHGPGTDHAEIAALRKLGGEAPGATLYVNLEPCNHHGRTPPCAPAVAGARVARVVIGIADPIAGHGGGIAVLRRAGIQVTTGVLAGACARANRPFLTWAAHGRPAFTLKAAITLDGKIATVAGRSKWITGEAARSDVMRLRDHHDAVLVGVGTVLADDPRLTARRPGARDPLRIVVDSQLRTPLDAQIVPGRRGGPRTIIACALDAPARREAQLIARGAEVWRLRAYPGGRVDLRALARRLGQAGVTSVLVEGGGEIHADLLARKLADEVVLYIAPKIVGGPAKSWVGGAGVAALTAAYPFRIDGAPVQLEADLRITLVREPRDGEPPSE